MTDADVIPVPQISVCLKIPNISKLDSMWSHVMTVQGIPWKVRVKKRTYDKQQYFGFFLYCEKRDKKSDWSHAATATFKLLPYDENLNATARYLSHVFTNNSRYHGFSKSIKWCNLVDPAQMYVEDDSINLDIKIEVADLNQEKKSDIIFKSIDKCCDNGGLAKSRLTIVNIQNLIIIRTPNFKLRNFPWSFEVFKTPFNTFGISIINMDSEGACEMKMIVKLDSPKAGKSIEIHRTERIKGFDQMTMESVSQWNELMKLENGFLENNLINIEIELHAKNPDGVEAPEAKKRRTTSACRDANHISMQCPICLEAVETQEVSFITCGHLFCSTCIANSMERQEQCPICRTKKTKAQVKRAFLPIINST